MENKISDLMFLTSSEESKKNYSELINRTVKAIVNSFVDEKAFAGLTPYELKKTIHVDNVLPETGVGMDNLFSMLQEKILPNMLRTSSTDYMAHLHTLALCESIAAELIIATYNQSMDSWDQSPAATEIEVEVVKCIVTNFCEHFNDSQIDNRRYENMTAYRKHKANVTAQKIVKLFEKAIAE